MALWEDLPAALRATAEEAGSAPILRATPTSAGTMSALSVVLDLGDGTRAFCKGTPADAPNAWMHRNEANITPVLPYGFAPRPLWNIDEDGWLLTGFEFVTGEHVDLTPGSPDLSGLADLVATVGKRLTPAPHTTAAPLSERWASMPEWGRHPIDILAGSTLLHMDMNANNIIVNRDTDRFWLVDWAWSATGAAWIDPALIVIRLINAGHDPVEAEQWAKAVPAFHNAPDAFLDIFADVMSTLWTRLAVRRPTPHSAGLARAAQVWFAHRSNRGR
ncbi:hypothetical protein Lfu02_55360 [Longispora fulva]|uniref:Aminoglycoside phosphotransferase n=1 Tax=Longispora fulva TaxID=619741 RepID=A0A8J7KL34_9ACTN|nr:hypothetical protein [Longispora fulva]MBG6137481.1 hypothetical protein [Longispora fulva]GIG61164.1 hypothetical protein Lfu02_55360 [Longispora fulva]